MLISTDIADAWAGADDVPGARLHRGDLAARRLS